MAARPTLALVFAGGALLVYMSSASQHAITWLVQERGFPYARAAALAGVMVALGGLVGNVAIGAFADRWRPWVQTKKRVEPARYSHRSTRFDRSCLKLKPQPG